MRSLILLLAACSQPPVEPATPSVPVGATTECFTAIAEPLAADDMQGRGIGTAGLAQAADLLEARMQALGLQTLRQPFEVTIGVTLGPDNALSDAVLKQDFVPAGFSSSGAFEGELVLAGYGIVAEDLGYNDYAGLDVKGKVVVAMRYEPGEADEESPFDGKRASRFSDLRLKAMRAREAGAAALILVNPPLEDDPDKVPALRTEGPESHAGLPVLYATRAWVAAQLGETALPELHSAIEADYAPHSRATGASVRGSVDVVPELASAENIVGVLPGSGDLAEETVVVGAHYDHLGFGGRSSMRPDSTEVHNGADDNASGVAAMLCAASQVVAQQPTGSRRNLAVAAFAAEELGLGGSSAYVARPPKGLETTVAMVNLDMVGRLREGKLQALGADSAPEWAEVLAGATPEGLTVEAGGDGYGPSDHMSFYATGVPVLHFFTGSHDQYHSPEDDYETLNVEGSVLVSQLTAEVLETLLTSAAPTYQEATESPTMQGDARGYGAWLGTVPDYSTMMETTGGVKLSGVRAGGPAALAGLQPGDVIVGLAGVEIQNLYDMTFVLRDHKPRDTIEVRVLREGAEVVLQATLGSRSEAGDSGGHAAPWQPKAGTDAADLLHPEETHLGSLRQLTKGGENAEAYWSPDGKKLIFQKTGPQGCDQQYELDLDTGEQTLVSSGKGRTTCGYYSWPEGERFIYATTEGGGEACPPSPDHSLGYVWPLYDSFDLVWQDRDGAPAPFLASPGYDAEATVCMTDGRVVFTSVRDGDLELYSVNADGSALKRLTHTPGYDGGAFFTHDCSQIVWRASRPEGQDLADYEGLLAQGLVRPSKLDLYAMAADGSDVRRLTDNGAANFGPYPTPGDTGLIFASNLGGSAREFDLYVVPMAGGEPERITYTEQFDGFPMFSPDGEWLVFASNRGGTERGETNLFLAAWKP